MNVKLSFHDQLIKSIYGLTTEESIKNKKYEIIINHFENKIPDVLLNNQYFIDINKSDGVLRSYEEAFINEEKYFKKNTKDFYEERNIFNLFKNLAYILDDLIEQNIFTFALLPDKLYFDEKDDYKIWYDFNSYSLFEGKIYNITRNDFINYISAAHKNIFRENISPREYNHYYTNYAYLYLLFISLIPIEASEIGDVDKKQIINNFGIANEKAPLELASIFQEIILNNNNEGGYTPVKIFKKIKNIFNHSINKPRKYEALDLKIDSYSQKGIVKKRQEDQYYTLKLGESALIMVADGISKSDIGNGRMASTAVLDYFEENELIIKDKLKKLNDLNDGEHKTWQSFSHKYIREIIYGVEKYILKKLNNITNEIDSVNNKAVMATTINIVLITGNKLTISWLGDSPAYLYRGERLVELIEPHNLSTNQFKSKLNSQEYNELNYDSSDNRITKCLPYGIKYDKESESYQIIKDNYELEFKDFFFKENDLLIIGSDGIVDCFSRGEDKLKEILNNLFKNEKKSFAYELTKAAAEDRSNDNITAVTVYFTKGGDQNV